MPSGFSRLRLSDLVRQDPAAWRIAFSALWPLAWRVTNFVLRGSADAEDVAAEAMGQLPLLCAKISSPAELEALTIVVARRCAASHLRARFAKKRDARRLSGPSLLEDVADASDLRQEVEQTLDLHVWLDRLDTRRRALVEAHFLDGKTSVELGATSGLDESTVRGLLGEAVRIMNRAAANEIKGCLPTQRIAPSLRYTK